ncbi:Flp pilus assembly protein CpaB [Austwickia chelonae]|uniref:Flp pilus assembly protein CpaB n=1 Tax=Austwickia chelonae TaxID=100225 RepID=UPI00196786A4|nr:SAF domain-containing protein [Austwickia chelonae]
MALPTRASSLAPSPEDAPYPLRRGATMPRTSSRSRTWKRATARRVIAGSCALAACWLTVHQVEARSAPEEHTTLVATRDLPVGHVLTLDDLSRVPVPRRIMPTSALDDLATAVGRTTTASITRGEILTSPRVRAEALALPEGRRALHLPLGDSGALVRLSPGDHVDVVAVRDGSVLAADAVVLDVDKASSGPFGAAPQSDRGLTVSVSTAQVGPVINAGLGGSTRGVHIVSRGVTTDAGKN